MKFPKYLDIFISFLLFMCTLSTSIDALGVPESVQIKGASSLFLTRNPGSTENVGIVYPFYTYPVLDYHLGSYQVQLDTDLLGWVPANDAQVSSNRMYSQLKVLSDDAVLVQKTSGNTEDWVGQLEPDKVYPIHNIKFKSIKIETPDSRSGWLDLGNQSVQVSVNFKEVNVPHGPSNVLWERKQFRQKWYADFSTGAAIGNFQVKTFRVDDNPDYKGSFRLLEPGKSKITFSFIAEPPIRVSVLSITHLVADFSKQKGLLAPITLSINGQVVLQNWRVGSTEYTTDYLVISRFLKEGENQIEISLSDSATGQYWIKQLSLFGPQ